MSKCDIALWVHMRVQKQMKIRGTDDRPQIEGEWVAHVQCFVVSSPKCEPCSSVRCAQVNRIRNIPLSSPILQQCFEWTAREENSLFWFSWVCVAPKHSTNSRTALAPNLVFCIDSTMIRVDCMCEGNCFGGLSCVCWVTTIPAYVLYVHRWVFLAFSTPNRMINVFCRA